MRKFKILLLTCLFALFVSASSFAQNTVVSDGDQNTVTTECGSTYVVPSNNVSVSASNSNGESTVTIYADGSVWATETCQTEEQEENDWDWGDWLSNFWNSFSSWW